MAVSRADRLEQLTGWYDEMLRIRSFEEVVAAAHQAGDLPGLLHLSMGGEAVTAGVFAQLRDEDRVYSAHRPHGHFLAGGVDPKRLMAELAGRESGLCRGRGGTMHLMSERVVMATGVVGGTLPVAVGHAMTQPDDAVVVVIFGDGAVQTGYFHESMNLAALWRAPVLFVCENNGWAEFSSRDQHTTVGNVVRYGDLYRIPAREVDGTDPELVSDAAGGLLEHVRTGRGPALLECQIARLRSHYEGDWREQTSEGDPLPALEQLLTELGADPDELNVVRDHRLEEARTLRDQVLAEEPPSDPAIDLSLVFAQPLS